MQPVIKQKDFEALLDYIDEHIKNDRKEIVNGLMSKAWWIYDDFKATITDRAGFSIYSYIRKRKLYFAFLEMKADPQKTNEVISGFYLGASAPQLCRSFKAEFKVTITEAKTHPELIKDNRLISSMWYLKENNKTEVFEMDKKVNFTEPSEKMIDFLIYAEKEYGFSPDLCYAVANIANRLRVPMFRMLDVCFDLMIDVQSDPNYISPESQTMIDLGISSPTELNKICEYFGCQYWELDSIMVRDYFSQDNACD